VTGWGSEWAVYFRGEPPRNYNDVLDSDNERAEAFRRAMFARGILEPPFAASDRRLCLALSDEDIEETVEAAADAILMGLESTLQ
jgi:glutamate-1-semialdehyde aminotransferase